MRYLDYFWIAVAVIVAVFLAVKFLPILIKKRRRKGDKYDLSHIHVVSSEDDNSTRDTTPETTVTKPKTSTISKSSETQTQETQVKLTPEEAARASVGFLGLAGNALGNSRREKKPVEERTVKLLIEYTCYGKKGNVIDTFPLSAYEDTSRSVIKKYLEKRLGTYQFNIIKISQQL